MEAKMLWMDVAMDGGYNGRLEEPKMDGGRWCSESVHLSILRNRCKEDVFLPMLSRESQPG